MGPVSPPSGTSVRSSRAHSHRGATLRTRLAVVAATALLVSACTGSQPDQAAHDLVVANGRVMDPASGLDAVRHVGIRAGTIITISETPLERHARDRRDGPRRGAGIRRPPRARPAGRVVPDDGARRRHVGVRTGGRHGGRGRLVRRARGRAGRQLRRLGRAHPCAHEGAAGSRHRAAAGRHRRHAERPPRRRSRRWRPSCARDWPRARWRSAWAVPTRRARRWPSSTRMFRVAAEGGASVHIHLRGGLARAARDDRRGARDAGPPLHVVHVNSVARDEIDGFLAAITAARDAGQDVTTEAYPYGAGMTEIQSALFDDWETWPDAKFGEHQLVSTGERLTRATFAKARKDGGTIIIHNRSDAQTRAAIVSPLSMIASDGFIEKGRGHPRTSGTYAKVLGQYVRDEGAIPLMEALAPHDDRTRPADRGARAGHGQQGADRRRRRCRPDHLRSGDREGSRDLRRRQPAVGGHPVRRRRWTGGRRQRRDHRRPARSRRARTPSGEPTASRADRVREGCPPPSPPPLRVPSRGWRVSRHPTRRSASRSSRCRGRG